MTPREILLSQHREAEPKLDALRQEVLAGMHRPRLLQKSPPQPQLRTWFGVGRWRFITLATAWLIVVLLQLDMSLPIPATDASAANISPRQLTLNMRENRRYLLETLDVSFKAVAAPAVPGPRSGLQLALYNA
jgi:hypothetical protein